MEFWLTFDNNKDQLQLPVPPREFRLNEGQIINTAELTEYGEIALIGQRKLVTVSLESFFPNQEYFFVQYKGFPKPYECVRLLRQWKESLKPVRFIVTDTSINLACVIESFEYGEQDGTGDVYFTLQLKEYRFIT